MSLPIASEKLALRKAADILGGQAALAAVLGYSDRRNVTPWFATGRQLPAVHCPVIERATNGAVMRWDLRPNDWHRIWPELINHPAAPAVPAPATAQEAA